MLGTDPVRALGCLLALVVCTLGGCDDGGGGGEEVRHARLRIAWADRLALQLNRYTGLVWIIAVYDELVVLCSVRARCVLDDQIEALF